jgi:hypothetical protein
MSFQSGGSKCCDVLVSFGYNSKTGDISVISAAEINTAEFYIEKKDVGDFDGDENVDILVGICQERFS